MSENILAVFNKENVSEEEGKNYRCRRSVRAVVFDSGNKIAMLYVKRAGKLPYYTLPGGGVGKEETFDQAIVRECKEEIGCDIEIKRILGSIVEYWKEESLCIQSFGYVGKVLGSKGVVVPVGDEDEGEKNTTILWVTLAGAIKLMESNKQARTLYMQYVYDRDLLY
ncbi:MAG: NUDIX hydrolase, partial [uncultured bacterium]